MAPQDPAKRMQMRNASPRIQTLHTKLTLRSADMQGILAELKGDQIVKVAGKLANIAISTAMAKTTCRGDASQNPGSGPFSF